MGFDGDPVTVSSGCAFFASDEAPNLKPPDNLLPCFLDMDDNRRKVDAVLDAKPAVDGEGGTGTSEAVVRCSDERESLRLAARRDDSPKPFHSSASHPLVVARGAGAAETGLILCRLRGVASTSSMSDSESLPVYVVRCEGAEKGMPGGGGEVTGDLYGEPGDGDGRWKPRDRDLLLGDEGMRRNDEREGAGLIGEYV